LDSRTATTNQKVRYQVKGTTASIVKTLSTSATSLNITGLTPSTTYQWKVKGDCWSGWKTFTTNAQKLDGISENSASSLSVYPNPASDNLYVNVKMNDSKDHEAVIQIVNMMGQVLTHSKPI
jgi:hypothetical protein